ncbi:MAG: Uma2 family endonuclease [Cyanobacteria bacterium J055]|nr:MAG: Uma2 family endonuclease [Cyanobacteria bacterium J055]
MYATAGVREYWVLDLVQRQLIVFRHPEETDYQSRVELKDGTIAPLAFPEVEISVSQLLG